MKITDMPRSEIQRMSTCIRESDDPLVEKVLDQETTFVQELFDFYDIQGVVNYNVRLAEENEAKLGLKPINVTSQLEQIMGTTLRSEPEHRAYEQVRQDLAECPTLYLSNDLRSNIFSVGVGTCIGTAGISYVAGVTDLIVLGAIGVGTAILSEVGYTYSKFRASRKASQLHGRSAFKETYGLALRTDAFMDEFIPINAMVQSYRGR